MSYTDDEFNRATGKILDDFRKAITDAGAQRTTTPIPDGDSDTEVPAVPEARSGGAGAEPGNASRASDETSADTTATFDDCADVGP